MKVNTRWMIEKDLPEVLSIEAESFLSPWSEEDLRRCLSQRNAIGISAGPLDDTKRNDITHVDGFMVYELHRTRLQVLNFAVAMDCRRQGVGRKMVELLQSKLSLMKRTKIWFEVPEYNDDGLAFLRALGWRAKHIVRDRFEDDGRDAYLMQYTLPGLVERDVATLGPLEANG